MTDAPKTVTVSQYNAFVRAILEQRAPQAWVTGEIVDWKIFPSGHCYFTLSDKRSSLRCVIWAREAERLVMHPSKGMQVRAFGFATLHEKSGSYQLEVQALESEQAGGLRQLYVEKTRRKLAAEGLLPKPQRKAVPRFPMTVGVVTSPVGAAFEDIKKAIARRAPWTTVVLAPVRVQGEGAAREIADGMRALYKRGGIDVIIVARGGGSTDDLWAFEDEHLARAIAKCPIPVVTGIGHATDVSTADLVADFHAATPTAAAETVAQDRDAIEREFGVMRNRMANAVARRFKQTSVAIESAERDLIYEMRNAIRRRHDRIARVAGKLEALSPLAALARGYSVALDENGHALRSVDEFEDRFILRVTDGRVKCSVESKEKLA
ncbi:MAG TPA: exodeoxyribonuclease VII large subunit [Longimicrobiales bacterium]|nr:exodeoxyribonuclease VII large subunit [Longimicrobiales bacterium]